MDIITDNPHVMTVAEYRKRKEGSKKKGSPEHDEQVFLFEWANIMANKYPELKFLFAIPNGGQRNVVVATRMKAEGVKSGVPDVFLPVPFSRANKSTGEIEDLKAGLWIEMKVGSNKPSANQKEWLDFLEESGYQVEVCYSGREAVNTIIDYLMLDEEKYEEE